MICPLRKIIRPTNKILEPDLQLESSLVPLPRLLSQQPYLKPCYLRSMPGILDVGYNLKEEEFGM